MKERNFFQRLNDAIEGLISIFREQKNMKLHLLVGVLIIALAVFLGLKKVEFVILVLAISFILFAEMLNSSLEWLLNFVHPEYHPALRKIKDALAGSVLFTGIVVFTLSYFLFSPYLVPIVQNGLHRLKGAQWHLAFFTFLLVISAVIISKAFFQKGRPLRGGVPSGHSALAFSIWTMVTLLAENSLLSLLVFFLALMVSASRWKEGIHNLWEIILGGMLGFLITITIFQFFSQ